VKEISSALSVHPKTLYKWTALGRIPYLRINGLLRFSKKEVEDWQDKNKSKAPQYLEVLPKFDPCLEYYDKMLLKGEGALSNKSSKRVNYSFGAIYSRRTKQGKDRWYLDYRDTRGKRIQRVIRQAVSRQQAAIALQKAVQDVFNAKHNIKPAPKPVSFPELADQYIERYAKTNKRSWKTDRSYIKSMTEYFGNAPLSEISSFHIEGYKAERLKQHVRHSTVNRCLAVLRRMLNLSVEWGYLQEHQRPKFKLFSEKDNLKERILTQDEETKLFQASATHLRPILTLALHSGMRLGEILSLTWTQIDLKKGLIRVERTKSGLSRLIPVNSALYGDLRATRGQSSSAFLFRNAKTEKPLGSVKTAFKAACRRAGISGLRFHDLRHTFASRLVERGADLITVKELLGHSSVKITERYTHSQSEQKKSAVALLVGKNNEKAVPEENLLRICDTAGEAKPKKTGIPLYSAN
jgi:excisionase family DNA binding protein